MRKIAFALLLLAASSAAAQVVGSIEQSYGPYARDPTNAYLGLAASRDRILLAWSEAEAGRSRIRIGLLDFDGRLVAPIETISTLESDYAFAPIVASDGSGFAVLYSELERPARLVRATVDATGHLIGSPQRFLSTVNVADNVPLFWDGTSYVAYVEGFPMAFAADGTRAATAFGPIDPFATLILENGTLAVAWWRRQVIWGRCHPMWFCEVIGYTVDLDWVVGNRGDTYRPRVPPLPSESVPPRPFVGTSGTKTLIAWVNEGIHYYVVDNAPRELATALNADPNQRLAVACDAKLCLLAYATTSGDVYALALDVSRPDDPRVLPVATSGRKEWHPQILKLKAGRFLIAYLSDLPGDLRFAGRIVTVPPSRTRSAGK